MSGSPRSPTPACLARRGGHRGSRRPRPAWRRPSPARSARVVVVTALPPARRRGVSDSESQSTRPAAAVGTSESRPIPISVWRRVVSGVRRPGQDERRREEADGEIGEHRVERMTKRVATQDWCLWSVAMRRANGLSLSTRVSRRRSCSTRAANLVADSAPGWWLLVHRAPSVRRCRRTRRRIEPDLQRPSCHRALTVGWRPADRGPHPGVSSGGTVSSERRCSTNEPGAASRSRLRISESSRIARA